MMANGLSGVTYELVLSPVESEIPERRCPLQPGVAFKVGRKEDNDFVIPVKGVSSQHLEISLPEPPEDSEHGPVVWVKDVSTNGTGVQEPGSESLIRVSKEAATTKLPHGGKIVVPFKVKSMEARTKLDVQVIKVVPQEVAVAESSSAPQKASAAQKARSSLNRGLEDGSLDTLLKEEDKNASMDTNAIRLKAPTKSSSSSSASPEKKKVSPMTTRTLQTRKTFREPQQDEDSAFASVQEEAYHLSETFRSFGDELVHGFDEQCIVPPPPMKMKMNAIGFQQAKAKAAKEAMSNTNPATTNPVEAKELQPWNTLKPWYNNNNNNPVKAKDGAAPESSEYGNAPQSLVGA